MDSLNGKYIEIIDFNDMKHLFYQQDYIYYLFNYNFIILLSLITNIVIICCFIFDIYEFYDYNNLLDNTKYIPFTFLPFLFLFTIFYKSVRCIYINTINIYNYLYYKIILNIDSNLELVFDVFDDILID